MSAGGAQATIALLVVIVVATGCRPPVAVFQCANSSQCEPDGVCEVTGYCSFSDQTCESGRRYSPHAGEGLADRCSGPGSSRVDASAPPDGLPACEQWQPRPEHFDPCQIPAPLGPLTVTDSGFFLSTWTFDSSSGTLRDPNSFPHEVASVMLSQDDGPEVRLLSVESLVIEAGTMLRLTGDHPVVIASWNSIVIEDGAKAGLLDASSDQDAFGGESGPGANSPACMDHSGYGGHATSIAEGGGGGGFGGNGGAGGRVTPLGGANQPGGSRSEEAIGPVRGGCPGGDYYDENHSQDGGGAGGGAVQLTARVEIAIAGIVDAGGAGGDRGSTPANSGAGGGSGGYIGLDAPTLAVTGTLAARGGGGGSRDLSAGDGGDGGWSEQAVGGFPKSGCVAHGGDGSFENMVSGQAGQDSGDPTCAAGGGGGGHGLIAVWGTLSGDGVIDPPVIPPI